MKVLSEQQVQSVCEQYQSGKSSILLGKEYGVSGTAILGLLDRRGIERRSKYLCNKRYFCADNFFNDICTEVQAYWLGFIAADGCISGNALKVTLSDADASHLERLRETLSSNHPIAIKRQSGFGGNFMAATLYITSPTIVQALASHGLGERKTHTHLMPDLDPLLLPHYLRGYVDGDGGFYVSRSAYKAPNIQFSVTANPGFLTAFQIILIDECGLNATKFDKRNAETEVYTLRYGGRRQVKKVFDYLYNHSTVCLPRKREKVEPYL